MGYAILSRLSPKANIGKSEIASQTVVAFFNSCAKSGGILIQSSFAPAKLVTAVAKWLGSGNSTLWLSLRAINMVRNLVWGIP